MTAQLKPKYTLEEYLALERESDVKYEYFDGEVFAMSGGTLWHDVVTANTHEALRDGLKRKPCRVFTGNMQIKTPKALPYRYADGSVACGKPQVERFNGNDLLLNPILLYEVLSPSTEAYDRGDKFTVYKSILSLREYLLIAQHRPHVAHYVRQESGIWHFTEYNDLSDSFYLPNLDCTLALSDIYRDVEFPPFQHPHPELGFQS
jgi:Uma2 family endonuclease